MTTSLTLDLSTSASILGTQPDLFLRFLKTKDIPGVLFFSEAAKIPERIRQKIEDFAFGNAVQESPFSAGKVDKLRGYDDFYKVRLGSYRWGLRIDQENQVIEFRRVPPRQAIYRNFP